MSPAGKAAMGLPPAEKAAAAVSMEEMVELVFGPAKGAAKERSMAGAVGGGRMKRSRTEKDLVTDSS